MSSVTPLAWNRAPRCQHGVLRLRLLVAPERRQQLTELDEMLRLGDLADHRGVVADRGVGHPERHLRSGLALPKRCVAAGSACGPASFSASAADGFPALKASSPT